MVRTITIGSYISIQGTFVRELADGKIVVRVDNRDFTGRPVSAKAA